jgi:hypothetical protein
MHASFLRAVPMTVAHEQYLNVGTVAEALAGNRTKPKSLCGSIAPPEAVGPQLYSAADVPYAPRA